MLVIPKLKVTDGKNIILFSDALTIPEGKSIYLCDSNLKGKTLFLQAIYHYLKKSRKSREKLLKKENEFIWDISNKKKLYRKGSKDVLLIEYTPAILPNLTINQNIMLPLKTINVRMKNKIREYLQQFDLGSKQYNSAKNLSFSEMKIIELIRAVMLLPSVVLIDDFDLSFYQTLLEKVLHIMFLMQQNGTVFIATGKSENLAFSKNYKIENKKVIEV
ncbi:MAG: ATP-binding cassette domain-containing protein [Candidatus Cloacimonetes bacterium]|nr:ATP-binding cassette domain-containing protein [Candidatus Cloacimonadota bacterium]